MQYDVCREGYIYDATPSPHDIIEVNSLHYVFVESINLTLPIEPETDGMFRIYSDVPVCTVDYPPSENSYAMHSIRRAIHEWNKSKFKLRFDGVCNQNHYQDAHSIRISFFTINGGLLGNSSVGISNSRVTMNIGLDDSSKYITPNFNYLIGDGLN